MRGEYLTADNGRAFRAWRGIPYARPPLGSLRFKAPDTLFSHRTGIFDANRASPSCLQRDLFFFSPDWISGDENCLYLNVFAPLLSRKRKAATHPVMIFIHGPTFFSGPGSSYDPRRILSHDTVLVTFSYRVGPFGFLSTEDGASPGNYGLLDQVAVLKWVQSHISAFSGDPSRVTIFGQGAGAHSVLLHLMAAPSKGLFHAAIAHTGSPLCPAVRHDSALAVATRLASRLRCHTSSSHQMVSCLRQKAAKNIYEMPDPLLPFWRPVVDDPRSSGEGFLSEDPVSLLEKAELVDVPVIIGVTQDFGWANGNRFYLEGALQFAEGNDRSRDEKVRDMIGYVLHAALPPHSDEAMLRLTRAVMSEYPVTTTDVPTLRRILAEIFGDALINSCLVRTAKLLAKRGPTRFYSFEYAGNASFVKDHSGGPTFADDLLYLFRLENITGQLVSRDAKMSNIITSLWTSFARTGTPTAPPGAPSVHWPQVSQTRLPYLRIADPLRFESDFRPQKMKFWLEKVPQILGKPLDTELVV